MKFTELLKSKNLTTADIEQIYHGKDHACRCGCHGGYFVFSDSLIKKIADVCQFDNVEWADSLRYVNIPYGAKEDDMCFCVYFFNK